MTSAADTESDDMLAFTLDCPALEPRFLLAYEAGSEPLDGLSISFTATLGRLVTLGHGDWRCASGPFVTIRTRWTESGNDELRLSRLIEDERNRFLDHTGMLDRDIHSYTREPVEILVAKETAKGSWVYTDTVLGAGRFILHGAGSTKQTPILISIVSRGVTPSGLQLRSVHDLRPFEDGAQLIDYELMRWESDRRQVDDV